MPESNLNFALDTLLSDVQHEHYRRLVKGLAQALSAKPYADLTITDIVREAGVSRRTFYEHFEGRSDCLLALYAAASRQALQALREAIAPGRPWREQVENGLRAYLGHLGGNPTLLRTLLIEIWTLGDAGLSVRREVNREIAAFIQQAVRGAGAELPYPLALAVVGAIHELILERIEPGAGAPLEALLPHVTELVSRVAQAGDCTGREPAMNPSATGSGLPAGPT
ncbi:TetR/AcrR family transcriptional regulator [Cupriavidus sp. AU9028]|uniref:TetR/AcrR family transcriptional regulator n=1 Tax=Cupriavidus sp. AU9028 TaxID=2871157 RepID=UPI001C97D6A3|nr:TetR/AcrR family transcriptional regulator [Cupriavidus sp. AU9028]MBY4899137.1 TetR/AcrR family transcriptional regulator [Cupriavidus sp. AU9028]